jgi:excisionase family DNA binding protein
VKGGGDKPDLSARRPYRDTPDVAAAAHRLIRTVGKRIAWEDPEALEILRSLDAELATAWATVSGRPATRTPPSGHNSASRSRRCNSTSPGRSCEQPRRRQAAATREVAERFAVTPRTVLGWRERGLLPGYRIGGVLRFRESDLDALVANSRMTPTLRVETANAPAAQQRSGADTEEVTFDASRRLRGV